MLVRLKNGVLDPEGETIKKALHNLGYSTVVEVRTGKVLEVQLDEHSVEQARKKAEEFSAKLLANPVIETFEIQIIPPD